MQGIRDFVLCDSPDSQAGCRIKLKWLSFLDFMVKVCVAHIIILAIVDAVAAPIELTYNRLTHSVTYVQKEKKNKFNKP